MAIIEYALGLYSANSRGADYLSMTVTASTFRGMPVVGVAADEDISAGFASARVLSLATFCDAFDAPMLILDLHCVLDPTFAIAYMTTAAQAVGQLFDSAQSRQPVLGLRDDTAVTVAMAGPYVAVGADDADLLLSVQTAWTNAQNFVRSTQYHPYGAGMQAVSTFDSGGRLRPPVYKLSPGDVDGDLKKLQNKWLGRAVTSVSQYNTLLAAENAGRPGLARLVNAVLVDNLQLSVP